MWCDVFVGSHSRTLSAVPHTRFPTDWADHWPKIHTQASFFWDGKSFLISFPSKCRFLCFLFSYPMYNDWKDDEADCGQSRNVVYSHHQMITATINYDQFVIYDFSLRAPKLLLAKMYTSKNVWIFLILLLLSLSFLGRRRRVLASGGIKHTRKRNINESAWWKVNSWSLVVGVEDVWRFNVPYGQSGAESETDRTWRRIKVCCGRGKCVCNHIKWFMSSPWSWSSSFICGKFPAFDSALLAALIFLLGSHNFSHWQAQRVFKKVLLFILLPRERRTSRHRSSSWSGKCDSNRAPSVGMREKMKIARCLIGYKKLYPSESGWEKAVKRAARKECNNGSTSTA